jgi:hypothetical protein
MYQQSRPSCPSGEQRGESQLTCLFGDCDNLPSSTPAETSQRLTLSTEWLCGANRLMTSLRERCFPYLGERGSELMLCQTGRPSVRGSETHISMSISCPASRLDCLNPTRTGMVASASTRSRLTHPSTCLCSCLSWTVCEDGTLLGCLFPECTLAPEADNKRPLKLNSPRKRRRSSISL